MILHKKFGIAFPAKHFKITWKFIFWQIAYYCVMSLKILEAIACNSTAQIHVIILVLLILYLMLF